VGDRTAFERKCSGSWWCVCWGAGVFSLKDYYTLLLPHYLSGWIFIATSLKASGLPFTFLCWLMQLLASALLCLAYHFREILCNKSCVGRKFSGMLLDHVGNNGRLAFPIAELNNRFRNQLSCKLNLKYIYTTCCLLRLANQLLISA
jgi:hypothetical protein